MTDKKNIKIALKSMQLMGNENEEMIPLLSPEEEEEIHNEGVPDVLPILPVRNTVLFPGVVLPITVGRKKSIDLVKEAYKGERTIGVVSQTNQSIDDPTFEDLNTVGTVATILKMVVLPDGNTTIIIQGKRRFALGEVIETEPYIKAKVEALKETFDKITKKESLGLLSTLKDISKGIVKLNPEVPPEAEVAIDNLSLIHI